MRRMLALLLALALLPLSCAAETARVDAAGADAYFQGVFSRVKAVGGGVIVNRNGARLYSFFYGTGGGKGGRPVDENTVYKTASVSKLIAAIGVMQLKEAGKLGLDAPLTYGEGRAVENPRYPGAAVTLRQAMSHTSSLKKDAPYASPPPWASLNREDTRYFSQYAPGSHYEYANLNGGLLCSAVERASGVSFNTYMAEHVFAPLNINGAFAAHLLPDSSTLSNTYMADGTIYMRAENYIENDREAYDDTCDPDAHCRASVGGLYISLAGLEKLGQALACQGRTGDVRLLSPQAAEEMMADQAARRGSSVACESPYGLCLYHLAGEDGTLWYGHQGRWEGLLVDLFVEPITHTTVVFVMNGVGRSGNAEVDAKMLRTLQYIGPWLYAAPALDPAEDSFVVADDEEYDEE